MGIILFKFWRAHIYFAPLPPRRNTNERFISFFSITYTIVSISDDLGAYE